METIKAQDLMVGNCLNYQTSEGDIMPTTIDWQDIKWISEDPVGFNSVHSPIPLTENELVKLGVNEKGFDKRKFCPTYSKHGLKFTVSNSGHIYFGKVWIGTIHHLQNLVKSLTGKELTYADK